MAKDHARTMSTNPVISEYKEIHIRNSYRDNIRAHCMQIRHQGRICKNKDYPRLESISESKIGQGTTGTYWILQKNY